MLNQREILTAIHFLGLEGQCICIHSSMQSFKEPIENGAEGLLRTFLQAGCTVMVPTFSDMYEAPPEKEYMPVHNGAGDYAYFYQKSYGNTAAYTPDSNELTTEEMGVFPQTVLNQSGRIRGGNHLNSFTAIGSKAGVLINGQTDKDVYAPLAHLYEEDGFVLLAGVGLDSATAIHYAEQKAGRNPFVRWSKDSDGNTIPVSAGGCSDGFEQLSPYLAAIEKQISLSGSLWRCFRVRELTDVCTQIIRLHPRITHCGNPACDRCNDALAGGPDFQFP